MVVSQQNYNSSRGIVDVYSRAAITDNWTYYGTISNSIHTHTTQYFGASLDISSDGKVVVIGAYLVENTVYREGAAYVYEYTGSADGIYSGGSWAHRNTLLSSSPQSEGYFGRSVAISQDANYILVGEPRTPASGSDIYTGAVYSYVRSGNSWGFQSMLVDPDAVARLNMGDHAALRLSSDGTYALVGVRLSDDDDDESVGKVLYFKRTNATWAYVSTILHPTPTANDVFGGYSSVAISGDGTRALIGAPSDDTPYSDNGAVLYYDFSETTITDASTQVFTVSGASFDQGLAINLVGADGTNYDVVDRTFVNTATATFKLGDLSSATAQLANRPYNVKITGGSGLATTSTQTIGLGGAWTSPAAGATLSFNTLASVSHTLVGTDAVGGTSGRTFEVVATGNALPSGLSLNPSSGEISGIIGAANPGTNVTFRVVDVSGAFVERTFSIVGETPLYDFSSFTFTPAKPIYAYGSISHTTALANGSYGTLSSTYKPLYYDPSDQKIHYAGSSGNYTAAFSGILPDPPSGIYQAGLKIWVGYNTAVGHPNPGRYPFIGYKDALGAMNAVGPTLTQMRSEYSPSWTDYTSNLNSLGQGVQLWTVPETATYTIDAYGASGGSTPSYLGGLGAQVRGDFQLTKGEIIRIVVGQPGAYATHTQNSTGYSASGGGGSYVVRTPYNTDASILVIAGGGGGAAQNSWTNAAGNHAPYSSTSGGNAVDSSTIRYYGGTNGDGGNGVHAGGGAGFSGNGLPIGSIRAKAFTDTGNETSAYTSGLNHSVGGLGVTNWGVYPSYLAWGGFGGGGGGGGLTSGGGGGYSGGATGYWSSPQQGQGGGSYNNGTNPFAAQKSAHGLIAAQEISHSHTANGKVIITKL
tara:strand:- start:316 stop:2922 length:2607 start_codon:yes stop_codon:yes gene_type:complete